MGKVQILSHWRRSESWTPFELNIDVTGTAFDVEVEDRGSPLRVTVILEPTEERYLLEYDRRDVIAYLVGTSDRIGYVTLSAKNPRGGIYLVKNSDFHRRESEWDGHYTAEGTHHLAIPAVGMTIEILSLELPIVRKLTKHRSVPRV